MKEADVTDKATDRARVQEKHKKFKAGQKREKAVNLLLNFLVWMLAFYVLMSYRVCLLLNKLLIYNY